MAVMKFNFLSHTLGVQQNITVIIPTFTFGDMMSGREEVYVPGMKYQTLYLLHGAFGDDSDWVNFTSIVRYADANKLAVVMPAANNSCYKDMAHGGAYWTYISEELPKMCQSLFPLSDKREDNFVAGLSMGGAGTMKLAINKTDMFAAAVCMSGASSSIDDMVKRSKQQNPSPKEDEKTPKIKMPMINAQDVFGDVEKLYGTVDDVFYVAKKNVEDGKELPKFFFACEDKDFALEGVKRAKDYLSDLGYDVTYDEVPGYGHEWDFWDLYVRKAIYEWLPLKRCAIYPNVK